MKISIFHFNQEQFYRVKRKIWRNWRLRLIKFILEITLQKINKNYKSQFLSYNIKNISISKLPLRVSGILFIFGRQMLNKTFVDLEYITSSCSTDGSLTSGSISANRSYGSKQVSPFFSKFGIPAALQPLEITCSPSDVVIWF